MKLRKLLFLCLLSATSVRLVAQFDKVDVDISNAYACPEEVQNGYEVRGCSYVTPGGGVLDLLIGPVGGYAMAFTPGTLDRRFSNEFINRFPEAHYKDNAVVQLQDKLYWMVRSVEKRTNKIIAYELNMQTGQCGIEGKVLAEHEDAIELGAARGHSGSRVDEMSNISFGVDYTIDRRYVVLHYQLYEPVIKDKEKYKRLFFVILDSKLNKIASREAISPYPQRNMVKMEQYTADSKGNIYFLSKVKDKAGDRYEISCLKADATSFQEIKLKIEDNHELFKITISEDEHGDIYAAGYTRKRESFKLYSNMYLYKLDLASGTATEVVHAPVPFYQESERMMDSMGLKGSQRYPYIIASECRSHQVAYTEAGDRIIIGSGHEYYGALFGTDQHFILSCIGRSGEVKWMKFIREENSDPINYILARDGIYILYSRKHDPSRYWEASVQVGTSIDVSKINRDIILSKISYDGKQADKVLAESKEMVKLTSANGVLLSKIKDPTTKQYQWVKVTLKD